MVALYSSCVAAHHERSTFRESTSAKRLSSHPDANPFRPDSMSKLFCLEKGDFFSLYGEYCQDLLLIIESPKALMRREQLHLLR